MKILEVTSFSAGFCGIWTRVSKEAELLSECGHEVYVFSSNIKRGSGETETASQQDVIKTKNRAVKIKRFQTFGSFGENTFFWNYKRKAIELKPDIMICHAYRQYYSTTALKIAKKLKIPCILVTHAPFIDVKTRGLKLSLVAWFYDFFIGKRIIDRYSKIFAITRWEIPYLLKLGAKNEKIIYMPNGIPDEFFKIKIKEYKNKIKKILFLGRVAPIKNVETLILAFNKIIDKNSNVELVLVGPIEKQYGLQIKSLVNYLKITNKVKFLGAVHNLKDKIKIIDNSDIFILPSKREGMPQALIEAMAREKIVITSNTQGGSEIVKDSENGYVFQIGNENQLAEKISLALQDNKLNKNIRKQARSSVEQFSWSRLITNINKIIKEQIK